MFYYGVNWRSWKTEKFCRNPFKKSKSIKKIQIGSHSVKNFLDPVVVFELFADDLALLFFGNQNVRESQELAFSEGALK